MKPLPGVRLAAMPAWVLLPLRAFLGVTFVFAGLQKLADRNFFRASAPSSIQAQLHAYARNSPIHGILTASSHAGVLVGLVIALAELAVGLGTLLGLWSRAAAAGGLVLALGFLLAVSWHSRPYYLGPDIVFAFAWTPLLAAGGGPWSLDAALRGRTAKELRLAPRPVVAVEFASVMRFCGAFDKGKCQLRQGQPCRPEPCPVLAPVPERSPARRAELDRRTFLRSAAAAGIVGAAAVVLGGITAAVGRTIKPARTDASAGTSPDGAPSGSGSPPATSAPTGPTAPAPAAPGSQGPPPAGPAGPATTPATTPGVRPSGTAIGSASSVPVGGAAAFTDPRSGRPAFVVQPTAGDFRGFSAVCTHEGCSVEYSRSSASFVCPCHGAVFSATSGAVLQGPARRPLPAVTVTEQPDGRLYAG
ncbi:MAG: thiosulfate dehydrogenase (quinone) large subunit [Acidimicrobiaceae bacterium]|nr:thiosulfate dehydrogenase (quinone) large subunit [Acidimicrobiaceae bacterium]